MSHLLHHIINSCVCSAWAYAKVTQRVEETRGLLQDRIEGVTGPCAIDRADIDHLLFNFECEHIWVVDAGSTLVDVNARQCQVQSPMTIVDVDESDSGARTATNCYAQ